MFTDLARDDVFRLETKHLWLRWPQLRDAAHIAAHAGDASVAAMTRRVPHPYPPGAAADFVSATRQANGTGEHLTLVMAPKGDPSGCVGCLGLEPLRGGASDEMELGYWLAPAVWGQGLASEAVQGLLDFAFGFSRLEAVVAMPLVENAASQRVLQRCGFAFVGTGREAMPARDTVLPVDRYRLDRADWQGRPRGGGGGARTARHGRERSKSDPHARA